MRIDVRERFMDRTARTVIPTSITGTSRSIYPFWPGPSPCNRIHYPPSIIRVGSGGGKLRLGGRSCFSRISTTPCDFPALFGIFTGLHPRERYEFPRRRPHFADLLEP